MSLEVKTVALTDPNRCCYCTDEILPEDLHIDKSDNSSYHKLCEQERNGKATRLEDKIKIKGFLKKTKQFRGHQINERVLSAQDEVASLANECLGYYRILNTGINEIPTKHFKFVLSDNNKKNFGMYCVEGCSGAMPLSLYYVNTIIKTKTVEEIVFEEIQIPIYEKPPEKKDGFWDRLKSAFLGENDEKEEPKIEGYEIKTVQKKVSKEKRFVLGQNVTMGYTHVQTFDCSSIPSNCRKYFVANSKGNYTALIARGHGEYKSLTNLEKEGKLDQFVKLFVEERDNLKLYVELVEFISELKDPDVRLMELQALFGKDEFQ